MLPPSLSPGRCCPNCSPSLPPTPDLRVAVAVARPDLRRRLAEAEAYADGWSSRLAQRALAIALNDEEIVAALAAARDAYAARRAAAAGAIRAPGIIPIDAFAV